MRGIRGGQIVKWGKKEKVVESHFVSRFSELFAEIHQKHLRVSFTGLPKGSEANQSAAKLGSLD